MPTSSSNEAVGVFERYRRDVYGWAYRLLGRHHDAQDATQDVFLRWLSQSRRGLPDNPRGWLRRVTINRAIDLLRSRRPTEPASRAELLCEPAPPLDEVEREELRGEVVVALEQLTESQRGVLIAKVYDGLSFARIAAEMSLAVPTVKTHYLRALSAVRNRLVRRWAPARSQS
ncbi:MAG: sigma-70 family RNA polymerase sigma factor [Phycisphaerae bacterium]|nr:sigma-70 family RNA polymerase sigma factor [Phycisphaerae bacterium]